MNRYSIFGLFLLFILVLAGCQSSPDQPPAPTSLPLDSSLAIQHDLSSDFNSPGRVIQLPQGFDIAVFASDLGSPRMMALGPDGVLYVSDPSGGRIIRLPDRDGNGLADGIEIAADDLFEPSGLAFYQDGSLYVAETSRVFRLEDPDGDGYYQERTTVISGIAAGGNINRTLIFSPDWRHLYLAVGSSCNVCQEIDTRRASILRFNSDGSEGRVFTSGLRNPIGLTLQPDNERFLWVSNIERDGLKNDLPPETIYAAFFDANAGWPSCHAGRIVDPEFGENDACETELLSPKAELEYQTSPMGIAFYLGDQYPDEYHNNLFVALHGEGEGDSAAGYKIIRIPFGEKFHRTKNSQVRDFATGWLPEDNPAWGTPFDIKFDTSGNLYVSDDTAGVIYLISYQSE